MARRPLGRRFHAEIQFWKGRPGGLGLSPLGCDLVLFSVPQGEPGEPGEPGLPGEVGLRVSVALSSSSDVSGLPWWLSR